MKIITTLQKTSTSSGRAPSENPPFNRNRLVFRVSGLGALGFGVFLGLGGLAFSLLKMKRKQRATKCSNYSELAACKLINAPQPGSNPERQPYRDL